MRRRTALGVAVAAVSAGAARLMAAQDAPGGQGRAGAGGPPVENKPLPKNDAEKKILAVLDELYFAPGESPGVKYCGGAA